MNFPTMTTATSNPKGGFTLVEAVVAAALMSLLVAASYIALSSASHAARLMSQRVTAHGKIGRASCRERVFLTV